MIPAPAVTRERVVLSGDGTAIAVYDGGLDAGERVYLSHATGFCAGAWAAVTDQIQVGWSAWDFRGHGRSGRGSIPVSWWDMGADVAAVRDSTMSDRSIGLGHSMGGAALLMAQLGGNRFDALVLYEPIVFPPPYRRQPEQPLARLARKRRNSFASREEARENYATKPPFDRWAARALDGYLEGGLIVDAGGARLACHPEFEAEVFTAAGAHGLLDRLPEIDVPVTIVCGQDTDTYPLEWAEELAATVPRGDLVVLHDTGHFGPMEHPVEVARIVESAL